MSKPITFILSDESIVNNQGFRLMTEGADLSQFQKNPVMLRNHNDWDMPIGRWENIRKEGGKILADAVFDMADEEAAKIAGKVQRGFLKMASMGAWPPKKWSDDPADKLTGQEYPTATVWVAREASIVTIGANNNSLAVQLYDEGGEKTDIIKLKDSLITKPNKTMSKMLFQILKLQDGASDEVVASAVQAIITERETLRTERDSAVTLADTLKVEIKGFRDQAKIELVDKAVSDKKIGADMRETYLSLADKDFDGTRKILDSMRGVTPVVDQLNNQGGVQLSDEQKKWGMRDWEKAGKAVWLKDSQPETFKRLFKEEYGVEPK